MRHENTPSLVPATRALGALTGSIAGHFDVGPVRIFFFGYRAQ